MKIRTLAFAAASALAAAAWAKAPLVPLYCYRFTDYDAAAGGFSRPARNYGTGEIPLTMMFWGQEKRVPVRMNGSEPDVGRWGTYSIQENAYSSFWLVGDGPDGVGCTTETGFTLSFWIRPPAKPALWTDFLGFRLGTEDYCFEYSSAEGNIQVYSEKTWHLHKVGGYGTQSPAQVNLDQWNHVCLVWRARPPFGGWPQTYGEVWLNGAHVGNLVPSGYSLVVGAALQEIHLGAWQRRNGGNRGTSSHTGLGEIALYGQPVSADDVQWLATHAPGPIPRGRENLLNLRFDKVQNVVSFANGGTLTNKFRYVNGGWSDATVEPGALSSRSGLNVNKQNGEWLDGDPVTGLGCSTNTGFTLSYWSRPTSGTEKWSDLFSLGMGTGSTNVRHEYTDKPGGYWYYGSCAFSDVGAHWTEAINVWHHHVLVWDPAIQKCQHWLDGEKAGTLSFRDMDDGVLRRFNIGTSVLTEGGNIRTQGTCNAGFDEVALYNFSFTDDQVAWIHANTPRLPAFTDTALARTVSGACSWDGWAADWLVPGTTRRMVWPAGEDGELTATLTASADAQMTVDTVVGAHVVLSGASGTSVALATAKDCVFAPASLDIAAGLLATLPAGTAVAGDLTLGAGAWIRIDAAALHAGDEKVLSAGAFVLPEGETDVLAHVEVVGADGVAAALSDDGRAIVLSGLPAAPAGKVVSGAEELDADADWTAYPSVVFAGGATLDLKGHSLTVAGFTSDVNAPATVTDSVGGGRLVVDVPAGATARNLAVTLTGGLKLVKNGAGEYLSHVAQCPYTGGTEVNAGMVRYVGLVGYSNPFGKGDARWLRVNEGAVFDLAGRTDFSTVWFSLNGGTLLNSKSCGPRDAFSDLGRPLLYTVRLEADSTMDFRACCGFRGRDGTGATKLDLAGHRLTVRTAGSGTGFCLYNTEVTAGEIVVTGGGYLAPGAAGVKAGDVAITADTRFTDGLAAGAVAQFRDVTFSDRNPANGRGSGVYRVSGTLTPAGTSFPNVELLDGATLDLSGKTGSWSAACYHSDGKVTSRIGPAADAKTVVVNLAGRTDLSTLAASANPYVVTWGEGAAKPSAKFRPDATTQEQGWALRADDAGIRLVRAQFLVILR